MKEIFHLALRSEYSFKQCFGKVHDIVDYCNGPIGIADNDNTFSHFHLQEACKQKNKKPIFSVQLSVVKDPSLRPRPYGQYGKQYIFIAKNRSGLRELYELVSKSTGNFFYRSHIGIIDVWQLSENIIVIAEDYEIAERINYLALSLDSPKKIINDKTLPKVAIIKNRYIKPEDKQVYQIFAGSKKMQNQTYPQHILSTKEWFSYFKNEEAIENTHIIANECNAEIDKGEPIEYYGHDVLEELCLRGSKYRNINLRDPVYKERYERELKLIDEKGFREYFMIVAEMVNKAKKEMLVGPSRGSSAGSLICYLIGITEVDPIKHGLLFERFIDINRFDFPDIDVDFPDSKRDNVIKELEKVNGTSRVKHIATISKMKPRSAINEFSKELDIPEIEAETVNNAMIKHTSGDVRFGFSILDTFNQNEIGKRFIEKYPQMKLCAKIENHARHSGIHAAGVIVSKREIINYGAINKRDNTIMLEGKEAEKLGLLKIDCLGLSTLTVLEECANKIGMDFKEFYNLPLNDDNVFSIFRNLRLNGIFQFEGYALQNLCRTIKVRNFEDIVAITSLARPGPLHGGSAALYGEIHSGKKEINYEIDIDEMKEITGVTFGTIIYQEQLMKIMREIGGMQWDDVSGIRKAVSKKKGKEFFDHFKPKFLEGTRKRGISDEVAENTWEKMLTFGAYAFNKSHAVAYAMISYWTAWAKYYYPLEFAWATLNNVDDNSAKKLMREMKKWNNMDFIPVDPEQSDVNWEIKDGKLLGGLTNIHGIGKANAKKIIRCRKENIYPPDSIIKKLVNPITEFDILFPAHYYWKELYENPSLYNIEQPINISEIKGKGEYTFIGKLLKKNVRDLNEFHHVEKRGGEILEEDPYLMNITVEDDTDCIMGRINRKQFERMGRPIAEEGREDKDWYLITGNIISDEIRFVFISNIQKLGDGINETIEDL